MTPAAAGTSGLAYRKFLPAVVAGAACWSATHIAIGAALGEAAKRIEGMITTGGLIVVGGLALALLITVIVRKRRKAAKVLAEQPTPRTGSDDADPELEPAN